jgi:class 3 adenylate cyclase
LTTPTPILPPPKHLAPKDLTTRSALEGERKRVTVMFADTANFMGSSEKLGLEQVHQIMDGCFKLLMDEIHRYEGSINQVTGDGVMALFVPRWHTVTMPGGPARRPFASSGR